ncbi:hypothetical protein C8J57DRAFT_1633799 [Mycena rebaudengoi]|nr:hypothetical protein C8J57DRAFT_1633799 [Mycena rebaudengoi]
MESSRRVLIAPPANAVASQEARPGRRTAARDPPDPCPSFLGVQRLVPRLMDADVGEGIRIQPGVIDRGGEIEQGQMLEEQGGEGGVAAALSGSGDATELRIFGWCLRGARVKWRRIRSAAEGQGCRQRRRMGGGNVPAAQTTVTLGVRGSEARRGGGLDGGAERGGHGGSGDYRPEARWVQPEARCAGEGRRARSRGTKECEGVRGAAIRDGTGDALACMVDGGLRLEGQWRSDKQLTARDPNMEGWVLGGGAGARQGRKVVIVAIQ